VPDTTVEPTTTEEQTTSSEDPSDNVFGNVFASLRLTELMYTPQGPSALEVARGFLTADSFE
jgi:hypothetical protein